jgi:uncharacterized protein (PEP-CTERM system associated)
MGITGTRAATDVERAPGSSARGASRSVLGGTFALSIAGTLALVAVAARAQTSPEQPTPAIEEPAPEVARTRTWQIQPTFSIEETLTNNVDLAPSESRRGDLVTQITPGFRVVEKGARTSLEGSVSLPILLYVNTGAENNSVYPQVSLLGNAELIERFFFVDAAANVSQQFLTPFGPQPQDLASATNNRYTSQLYRVSPYIKGEATGNIDYELRNDNIWSNLNDTPTTLDGVPVNATNSYTNQTIGRITRQPRPLGWQVDYRRNDVRFTDQGPQLMELGRLRLLYQPDPTLGLGVSGGYERNEFPFSDYSGTIYGFGYEWRPDAVTSSEGFWEHRFFGSSYLFRFNRRTPLSALEIRASRNITTYPQQLAELPAGGAVAELLNSLFSSRIVDPTERQRIVDQFIRDRGLPETLGGGPVIVYTQQVTLQDSANVTLGMIGVRNSIFLNVGYLRQEPIAGSGDELPPLLAGFNDNTQYGVNVVWTHRVTPWVTVGATASWSRTTPNETTVVPGTGGTLGTTNLTTVRALASSPLSPRTSVYAGARYQVQTSNLQGNEYNEAAVFAGLSYQFR